MSHDVDFVYFDIPNESIGNNFGFFTEGFIEYNIIYLDFEYLESGTESKNTVKQFMDRLFKFKLKSIIDVEDIKKTIIEETNDFRSDGWLESDFDGVWEEHYYGIQYYNRLKVFENVENYPNGLEFLYDIEKNKEIINI